MYLPPDYNREVARESPILKSAMVCMARKDYQMKLMTKTPLSALLGMTTFVAMTPADMNRGATIPLPRPTFAPSTGLNHGGMHPTAMTNPMRGIAMSKVEISGAADGGDLVTGGLADKGEISGVVRMVDLTGDCDAGIADVASAQTS
jgi:hypothetical protein